MKIKVVTMHVCEACLDGVGEECHTPGCAMWLHSVDLPFHPESYEVQREYDEWTKSVPVFAAPHNTGEREPSEMPDSAGTDT
jgi:hypothetical protein